MTIEEFCKNKGISRSTLYRKLKAQGVDPNSLRTTGGVLTDEGISLLYAITNGTRTYATQAAQTATNDAQDQTVVNATEYVAIIAERQKLREDLNTMKLQLDAAKDQIAQLQARIADMATEYAAREAKHNDDLKAIIDREQAAQQRLLPAGLQEDAGLIARLKWAIKGK